jgi:hypothetical protein
MQVNRSEACGVPADSAEIAASTWNTIIKGVPMNMTELCVSASPLPPPFPNTHRM